MCVGCWLILFGCQERTDLSGLVNCPATAGFRRCSVFSGVWGRFSVGCLTSPCLAGLRALCCRVPSRNRFPSSHRSKRRIRRIRKHSGGSCRIPLTGRFRNPPGQTLYAYFSLRRMTRMRFAAQNCRSASEIRYPSSSSPLCTARTMSSTFPWQPGICTSFPA